MDILERLDRVRQRDNGNPYREGSAQYRAWARGHIAGQLKVVMDLTTSDPKKIAAKFTGHYIIMRPDIFQMRLKAERKAALRGLERTTKP